MYFWKEFMSDRVYKLADQKLKYRLGWSLPDLTERADFMGTSWFVSFACESKLVHTNKSSIVFGKNIFLFLNDAALRALKFPKVNCRNM
jgi:hypothetical protein